MRRALTAFYSFLVLLFILDQTDGVVYRRVRHQDEQRLYCRNNIWRALERLGDKDAMLKSLDNRWVKEKECLVLLGLIKESSQRSTIATFFASDEGRSLRSSNSGASNATSAAGSKVDNNITSASKPGNNSTEGQSSSSSGSCGSMCIIVATISGITLLSGIFFVIFDMLREEKKSKVEALKGDQEMARFSPSTEECDSEKLSLSNPTSDTSSNSFAFFV